MSTDWMPGKRADQLSMAKEWRIQLCEKGTTVWNIPESTELELNNLTKAAEEAFNQASIAAERTPVVTAKCKTAFDELVAKMRDIKDRHFKSPPLTDPDFVSLGLKPPNTSKSHIPDPTGQAEADITYPGPHLLMLHIKPLEGTIHDERADYGYRIYYGVFPHGGATTDEAISPQRYLTKQPIQGDELPHSQFTRRKKEMIVFPAVDSGSTCYFCIRYENSKGKSGPWGPVFSAVIP